MSSVSTHDPVGTHRLDSFVREHGERLLRFAFLLTGGDGATAEDLVQAVLLRLTERGIDDIDDPLSYARRSVVNERISGARRDTGSRRALTRIGPVEVPTPASSDDRLAILGALAALSARERAAIVLRYYEDLPDREIAETLGCSRVTVRSLVHRGTKKLRVELATTYGPISERAATDGSDND